jgi:1,4-alpha-glucan branching enzyme
VRGNLKGGFVMAEKALSKAIQFKYEAPEARAVFIAGDFNNWDASTTGLKRDKGGVWKASLKLKPGRYEYKFIVDGEWRNDPQCHQCIPNRYGTANCIIEVK